MKTQRRTIYIADDGSEHQTKAAAELCDTRTRMLDLIKQECSFLGLTSKEVVDVLLQNGTYKFNK